MFDTLSTLFLAWIGSFPGGKEYILPLFENANKKTLTGDLQAANSNESGGADESTVVTLGWFDTLATAVKATVRNKFLFDNGPAFPSGVLVQFLAMDPEDLEAEPIFLTENVALTDEAFILDIAIADLTVKVPAGFAFCAAVTVPAAVEVAIGMDLDVVQTA